MSPHGIVKAKNRYHCEEGLVQRPLKVFIGVEMEGITGIIHWDEATGSAATIQSLSDR
jgi:hypothetical protein